MNTVQTFPGRFVYAHGLSIILVAVILALLQPASAGYAGNANNAFQSPLPEREQVPKRPATWVVANAGGELRFGSVTVAAPVGFTNQGGADIRVNLVVAAQKLTLPSNHVTGALFAIGIWPPNEQTEFEQPLELRILLDPVVLSQAEMDSTQFVQFDPAQDKWLPLQGVFRPQTYELITKVRIFTPVAKDFPVWGGRTFFAVVRSSPAGGSPDHLQPTVRANANIRSGPGTSFAVVRTVKVGDVLDLDGVTADGKWLRLADGSWIAAFLVADSPPLPVVDTE